MSRARGVRWEHRLLRALTYPANLALAGLAAFVLALGLVTALPAVIAASTAMRAWLDDGDDAVFTGTFRAFAATWRRTLPLGALVAAVVGVLVADIGFLWTMLVASASAGAAVLLAVSLPVAVTVGLLLLTLPLAVQTEPDGSVRRWFVVAGATVASRPVRSSLVLLLSVAVVATCVLVWTLAPFFALSVPAYLALVTLRPRVAGPAA